MKEIEFNLLEEPWIRVLRPDCRVEEVSLRQVLLQAQAYSDLAGELPTQDVAVLRLLLAVLHGVFGRVNAQGNRWRSVISAAQSASGEVCGSWDGSRNSLS